MSADLNTCERQEPAQPADVSLRRLFALAWPLALNGLVTVVVSANDVFLLGSESVDVLASAVAATSILSALVMTLTALGVVTHIRAARSLGRGDEVGARAAAGSTLRVALALASVPLLLGWLGAPWLTGWVGGTAVDPAIAGTYLRLTLLSLPVVVVTAVLRSYATALGSSRVVLFAGLAAAGVDIAASLVGRGLAGWSGVAVGTVLGHATGALVLVLWARRLPTARRPRWWDRGVAARSILGLGWPEMALALFSSASGVVIVVVLADAPPHALAASRLLDVQVGLAWVVLSAVGQALLTLLGTAEGARRVSEFRRVIRTGAVVLLTVAAAFSLLGGILATHLVELAAGPEVAAYVGWLGWVFWAQVWWQAACVLALAVCRAREDTRAALVASLIGEYAVFLPVGLVLCRGLGWELEGVVCAHHLFWATFVAVAVARARRGSGSSSSRPAT